MSATFRVIEGDCLDSLRAMPAESVQCVVTSPPYWGLRDYGVPGQIGLERTPDEFVTKLVEVFREVQRVLRPDGTLWLNLGDCYAGARGGEQGATGQCADRTAAAQRVRVRESTRIADGLKPKDLVGIPWRVAFALQADGWWLRADIIWHKPNPMPESVTDRPTKAHEYLFLLAKSERYFYDHEAIREKATGTSLHDLTGGGYSPPGQAPHTGSRRKSGNKTRTYGDDRGRPGSHMGAGVPWEDVDGKRNRRSVWTVATKPFTEAHFATFPEALVDPCILAGSRPGDTVLDPFNGAGTTGVVAVKQGRSYVGIELNPEYVEMSRRRIGAAAPLFAREVA